MASLATTYTFSSGTRAKSAEVNQNFTDVVNFVNTEVIHRDGAVAFTGLPTLPATDPTTANHATRKSYVDAEVAAVQAEVDAVEVDRGTFFSRKTKNGGGDALLVASGAAFAWNDITDFDTNVDEVDDHWYRAIFHVPALSTNKDAILSSVPTRLAVRIRRDGTEIAREWTSHMVDSKGIGLDINVEYQATATAADVVWSVQVSHYYAEATGGAAAAIRYNADTTFPMTFTVEDLGIRT
jgi:hypothetical protein